MQQYLDLVNTVLTKGTKKETRAGNTLFYHGGTYRHDMNNGFPILTTRKLGIKNIAIELEGLLHGITDKRWYEERGCYFWSYWCNPTQVPYELYLIDENEKECYRPIQGEKLKQWQKENPDLGPGYGFQLRNFNKRYKPIPFVWSGLDKTINVNINSSNKNVGKVFDTKYGKLTIIDAISNKEYIFQFNDTGYKKIALLSQRNKICDLYSPSVCGIGVIGEYDKSLPQKIINKLQNTWRNMIKRCYDINDKSYEIYGANGVYVCNRWLIFANFLEDVQAIPGWLNKLSHWDKYHLDKDKLSGYCYSKLTCEWLSKSENSSYTCKNYYFDAISPDGIVYENNINMQKFCRKHGLNVKTIELSIKTGYELSNGWKFYRKDSFKHEEKPIDQLQNIIDILKNNPNDRRVIAIFWNPSYNDQKALPECIPLVNLTHCNGILNLHFHQRSGDLMIGVPNDIATYALFLLLLCKETGLKPGILTASFADLHIYENHIETAKIQLTRTLKDLPNISIDNWQGIFNWTHKDVSLVNYHPHEKLQYEIAI